MPDLGPYAAEVLLAYAVTLVLLAALVWLSWRRHRAARRDTEQAERRRDG